MRIIRAFLCIEEPNTVGEVADAIESLQQRILRIKDAAAAENVAITLDEEAKDKVTPEPVGFVYTTTQFRRLKDHIVQTNL